jgi:hypothetical protein
MVNRKQRGRERIARLIAGDEGLGSFKGQAARGSRSGLDGFGAGAVGRRHR